ncbi:hypothetical protein Bp8pS_032 [Bacillus phage vB_BpuM-BpSp]|nr:hypothetical protein Bp8pS_032 [Bacillus phage vB_BpuM-BpSp]
MSKKRFFNLTKEVFIKTAIGTTAGVVTRELLRKFVK